MRSRVGIYGLAGAAFALAVLLSILGVGEEAGALTNWQALVLGHRPGRDRAAARSARRVT